jgi:pimeloyl-ACP methyl ester carboxylesterase
VEINEPVSRDAVIVLPGIMGSELVDSATGRTLWGAADPRWYLDGWRHDLGLKALHLSPEERAGRFGRITASRLIRYPAFIPAVGGIEPYTRLLDSTKTFLQDPAALLEFPYDWRLPVAHNAGELARVAARHLEQWRSRAPQNRDSRLVLVAHSMGGLVAWHFVAALGGHDLVRAVVTLGTPFHGSVSTVGTLATGRGTPVRPYRWVRDLAVTLPGVYDLLPGYRCVDEVSSGRALHPGDVAALGGDRDLAEESFAWRKRLLATPMPPGVVRAAIGERQPTEQAITLAGGLVETHRYTLRPTANGGVERVDLGGDGRVPTDAAVLPGAQNMPLSQTHSGLPRSKEGHTCVRFALLGDQGPWLAGETVVGLEGPDLVAAGSTTTVRLVGCQDSRGVRVTLTDVTGGFEHQIDTPAVKVRDGAARIEVTPPSPGLYRIEVKSGGHSPVSELFMSLPPDAMS